MDRWGTTEEDSDAVQSAARWSSSLHSAALSLETAINNKLFNVVHSAVHGLGSSHVASEQYLGATAFQGPDPAHFLDQFPLLPFPPFSYPPFPSCPSRSGWQVQVGGLGAMQSAFPVVAQWWPSGKTLWTFSAKELWLIATILVLYVWKNAQQKFLNQNAHQFRLHYVRGPTDTVGGPRVWLAQAWRHDVSLGGGSILSYIPAQNFHL